MKIIHKLRWLSLLLPFVTTCCEDKTVDPELLPAWVGRYTYLDQIPGPVEVLYVLTLSPKGECKLAVVGTQVDFDALCRVVVKPNELRVYYISEIESAHSPDPVAAKLKAGDLLFTITKSGEELKTKWSKIKPDLLPARFEKDQ